MNAGRYEVVGAIAAGGMASIELARDAATGEYVALKRLHAHVAEDSEFVAMFLDEARLAASIRHRNVVRVHEVVRDPLALVMDYVDGGSLHALGQRLAASGRRLPLPIALRIVCDLAAALFAAHELRDTEGRSLEVVHRDVSPHNVVIGTDGLARLTDFGIARAAARLAATRGGQVKGKLAYMAPEQVAGESLDHRADLYAAGIVLWELLVGRRLFDGASGASILAAVLQGPPGSPRAFVPEVTESIDAVCMRALANDRDARYATGAELGAALEAAALASGVGLASYEEVGALVRELGLGGHKVTPPSSRTSSPRRRRLASPLPSALPLPSAPEPPPSAAPSLEPPPSSSRSLASTPKPSLPPSPSPSPPSLEPPPSLSPESSRSASRSLESRPKPSPSPAPGPPAALVVAAVAAAVVALWWVVRG
jgi:serine/threonine protein kinase